ncbi:UDP-N-acetylglucosamine-N-acetylmuramylpentapeptide N-acetylglucosamine transferase [Solimonas aquatica]|uniref:UDP-N-acetylglucosamine--N-acetylmuramyl-(pentapeptide) pyrophosphoryl-undecaprenol N-acetylglucosamine transferase n=1 Tax=Solimonas aquatica TaxID=489703 RepID=A0A1H9K1U8_9GAMM|nr:undecaprenyldiphospho-muramoylpentapeptide beta-N-acetylglucosaminyltransferase [Solimonas aquatica]SEQ93074.1 UDP-N-acetylglucosamine-N-acetylmuramylpentapeptide N-acetylglucosamine transferase [Solimonas aquatica]
MSAATRARRFVVMAGGTGGHVYPGLAVAQWLRERGHEVVWMGTPDSFESRAVPKQGFALEYVRISGVRGKGVLKLLQAPLLIARAIWQARSILKRLKPDAVLGMGGFVSGPGGLAAWLGGWPLLIHEQNAAAGMTNRVLAQLARVALQAFPNTFAQARTVGNPVRSGFAELPPPAQRQQHEGPLRVLVVGGSQGARALNEQVPRAIARLLPAERPLLRHQGGRTVEIAQRAYAEAQVQAEITAFIDDMPAAYAWADLVICRAGASTIAELSAAGCASVLVPFPAAVDDHQTRNAQYLVAAGAALLLPEAQLSPDSLASVLRELMADRARLTRMAEAARTRAWPQATETIAQACLELAA